MPDDPLDLPDDLDLEPGVTDASGPARDQGAAASAPTIPPTLSRQNDTNSAAAPRGKRDELGRFPKGVSGNPKGMTPGKRKMAAEMRQWIEDKLLTDEHYRENLLIRIKAGEASAMEIRLWEYILGRPKQTVSLEGESRKPATIIFLGEKRDPLAEDDRPARRILPPVPKDMEFDLDEPPPEEKE